MYCWVGSEVYSDVNAEMGGRETIGRIVDNNRGLPLLQLYGCRGLFWVWIGVCMSLQMHMYGVITDGGFSRFMLCSIIRATVCEYPRSAEDRRLFRADSLFKYGVQYGL